MSSPPRTVPAMGLSGRDHRLPSSEPTGTGAGAVQARKCLRETGGRRLHGSSGLSPLSPGPGPPLGGFSRSHLRPFADVLEQPWIFHLRCQHSWGCRGSGQPAKTPSHVPLGWRPRSQDPTVGTTQRSQHSLLWPPPLVPTPVTDRTCRPEHQAGGECHRPEEAGTWRRACPSKGP